MTSSGAWDWSFAWSILPQLLAATVYTVIATVLSFVGALVIGLPFALLRDVEHRSVRIIVGLFVELIRSTPILVQVYFLYFILPTIGIVLPALVAGVLALALHYGTYVSEAYRAGIASVSKGQREAALALGLRPRDVFVSIVLPQALPPIVPVLGNYLIALFKETPLLSAIAIVELLQTAKLIGSETFRYNEPITLAGLILLALSLLSAAGLRRVERKAYRWR